MIAYLLLTILYTSSSIGMHWVLHLIKMSCLILINVFIYREYLFSVEGDVYVWDLDRRDCIHRFYDEGCTKGTSIALSPNGQYLACGLVKKLNFRAQHTEHLLTTMYIVKVCIAMLFCAIWLTICFDIQLVVVIFQVLQWSGEYLWYPDNIEL